MTKEIIKNKIETLLNDFKKDLKSLPCDSISYTRIIAKIEVLEEILNEIDDEDEELSECCGEEIKTNGLCSECKEHCL